MTQYRYMSIVHCANNAFGLFVTRLIEFVMDGCHDDIKTGEDFIRHIEVAISKNIDFHAFEHCETTELGIELVDLVDLARESGRVQSMSDSYPLAVIGKLGIGIAAVLCCCRHIRN